MWRVACIAGALTIAFSGAACAETGHAQTIKLDNTGDNAQFDSGLATDDASAAPRPPPPKSETSQQRFADKTRIWASAHADARLGPYNRPLYSEPVHPDYMQINRGAVGLAVSFKLGS